MYKSKDYENKMKKTVDSFKGDLEHIRAGRANPKLLDNITFSYYGVDTPLKQAASINVPEARMLTITPWDPKNIKPIEQAILASDLGITPSNDGKMIRLPFPPLTEERRKKLVKEVSTRLEEAKVSIRNIRRDGMDEIKKDENNKDISEDERYAKEEELQEITDNYIEKLEEAEQKKEEELMEI